MFLTSIVSIVLTLFSTAVMSYISMAIPIGPWIAPTVVLLALGIFKIFSSQHPSAVTRMSALSTSSASIGGIVATGVGFSYPAIYFLQPELFSAWLQSPLYFSALLAGLSFSAGALGIFLAHMLADTLIVHENLPFPIGGLVYKMIAAHQSVRKSLELIGGFIATTIFCIVQDGVGFIQSFMPKTYVLWSKIQIGLVTVPALHFDLWPLLWAIGFVTGHVIAVPLALGALSKIFVIDVVNNAFFSGISTMDFVLAFCSGMVLAGALQGFMGIPSSLLRSLQGFITGVSTSKTSIASVGNKGLLLEGCAVLLVVGSYLWYLHFSFFSQCYLVLFTCIVAYQLALIAGKIGLAPLGRFATFVMVPAMFLFKVDLVQIIVIATFVEVCGGVVADALFGLKIAQLGDISRRRLKHYQYLGLTVSALSIGGMFWLLISHFGLGSVELFAQKAQTRALLINAHNFNLIVVALGLLFGFLLKYIKQNPALILSGILMPFNLSLGLIAGGLLTYIVKDKEEWYPFWSGIFAANSIWMLLRTLL